MLPPILCQLANVYFLVLIARMLFSWFPPSPPESGMAQVKSVVFNMTEPVLAPVRRIVPPVGMIDLSFLVVVFGYQIVLSILGCGIGL